MGLFTQTTSKKVPLLACLGSESDRYDGGRTCPNQPVRVHELHAVAWNMAAIGK